MIIDKTNTLKVLSDRADYQYSRPLATVNFIMVVSMNRWVGKVAIVTGVSAGIGAAIADALVEHGVIVVGVARRSELVEKRAKELSGKKGKLHPFKADVTKEEDILKVFEWTTKNLGPVHILINNAGKPANSTLTEGKTEDWKSCFDLNVMALCVATREAVKVMKANKIDGHIIHINAVLGHEVINIPNLSVYPASKYAVTALTETLRQEFNHLGLKIKITSLSPGRVDSEFILRDKNNAAERMTFAAKFPSLKNEDVADGVIYALSTPEHVQIHELTMKPVGPP